MYKQLLFILFAASLLVVAGCANSADTTETAGSTEPSEVLDSTTEEVNDLDVSELDSLDEDLSLI